MRLRIFPVFALLTAALMVSVGCGSDTESTSTPSSSESAAAAVTPEAEDLDVTIDRPSDNDETSQSALQVSGTVSPATALVDLDGADADVSPDGTWSGRVSLELGSNPISVTASIEGSTAQANDDVVVVRKRTAAQRAAFRAAQKRKRERRRAALRANAVRIEPKKLQKDPDRYTDERVAISGEIFQIQEGGENFFLMNTECETDYDIRICNGPTVHVTYDFSTEKTEEDLVTVYGTVLGGLDYDTASGGSNYVASIDAEIIE